MPRRARIVIADIPWHIIQRGNNRSACFYADEDYRRYLETLREQADRHGCAIHAYVLMTNHVHLLLTPAKPESAALLMKHLGQRYVQYINRTYRRSGTLWEGRFRSCLTQSTDCVLSCYRYIELNPVRADMVRHPRDYRWSSYRANGDGIMDPVITPHAEYLQLGRKLKGPGSIYFASIEQCQGGRVFTWTTQLKGMEGLNFKQFSRRRSVMAKIVPCHVVR